jgi:glycosyltransferase involved in cell wall biosynthesis
MRILQVVPWFSTGKAASGYVQVVYNVSRELVKRGHEVEVYTSNFLDGKRKMENDSLVIDQIKVNYFNYIMRHYAFFLTPSMIPAVRKNLKEFDVIHIHDFRTFQSIVTYYYARKYNVPYVLQAHGSLPRAYSWQKLKWLYDELFGYKLLRDASKVIALTRVEAEQYERMGVPQEKIAIIPNGIDLSEYAELPSKGVFKRKFNIPEDRKIILYLGRIHKIKGIDFLVKAYAHLKNEMKYRDALLVIAGPDSGYLGEIKSLVQALGISNYVLFVGPLYREDKLAAYVDSEVYVLPSRYETFPMTLLEAYACEKPMVASKVGGLIDLVIDRETGLLFEPGNVKQLAKSILNLLNDNDVAKEMGLKGKNFVRRNFVIEKVVERLEKVYEEVVKR